MASNPAVYTDMRSLTALRGQAHRDPKKNLREVASQFEAIFIQNLLKGARAGSLAPGALDGPHSDTYREMYDQQLAITLAKGKGIGIADMLVRQLHGSLPGAQPSAPMTHSGTTKTESSATIPSRFLMSRFSSAPAMKVNTTGQASVEKPVENKHLAPEEFVASVWPAARETAEALGVDPKVLVAQAALESGWGRSVARHPDGQSSHNLFGIKADSRWNGKRTVVSTLEYEDGVAVRRRDPFRAYDSFAESFSDYARFLRSNPRYQDALTKTDDPEAFLQGLQSAGYATDPAYARKVASVLRGDTLRGALENL